MGRKPIHEQVAEILPWFVNNSLEMREQKKVLLHLRVCETCRAERDRLQHLQGLLQEETIVLPDYRFSYGKLANRIDAAEANRASTQGFGRLGSQPRRHLSYLMGAAASLAAAVMLVAALDTDSRVVEGQFRTLTTAPAQETPSVRHLVALRFDQPIRAETLREVLIETRATIVSGPSEQGTYMLEVDVPSTTTEQAFLQQLENVDGVSFVAYSDSSSNIVP